LNDKIHGRSFSYDSDSTSTTYYNIDEREKKKQEQKEEQQQQQDILSQIEVRSGKGDETPTAGSTTESTATLLLPDSQVQPITIDQDPQTINMWIIIGAIAGSAALISISLVVVLKFQLINKINSKFDSDSTIDGSNKSSSSSSSSSSNDRSSDAQQIIIRSGGEEISTLGDPMPMNFNNRYNNNSDRMEDVTASVDNDYDYTKYAYRRRGADSSPSFAGTNTSGKSNNNRSLRSHLEDPTRNTASDKSLGTNTKNQMMTAMASGAFFSKDDSSFEQQYNY